MAMMNEPKFCFHGRPTGMCWECQNLLNSQTVIPSWPIPYVPAEITFIKWGKLSTQETKRDYNDDMRC